MLDMTLGTAGLAGIPQEGPGWDKAAVRLLAVALDLGFGAFDTAPAYGVAEALLGKVLAGRGAEVTSKVLAGGGDVARQTLRSVHNTLRRVGTGHRLAVLLHEPCPDLDDTRRVLDTLSRLAEQDWIAAVGVCNVPAAMLRRLLGTVRVDVIQNELSYLCRDSASTFRIAERAGVRGTCYGALGYGALTGAPPRRPAPARLATGGAWHAYVSWRYLSAGARAWHAAPIARARKAAVEAP
jgi:aryl-alcohol dehydrogenase-like predicted oxidoreductase